MKILVFIDISIVEFFILKKFKEEEKKNLFYFSHAIQTNFFFIRNEEKYINRRKDTRERRDTTKREG